MIDIHKKNVSSEKPKHLKSPENVDNHQIKPNKLKIVKAIKV